MFFNFISVLQNRRGAWYRYKVLVLVLLVIALSIGGGTFVWAGDHPVLQDDPEVISLLVTIETTSDWTTLVFLRESTLVFGTAVEFDTDADFFVGDQKIGVQQTLAAAERGEECKVTMLVRVRRPPEGELLLFGIERGHIGTTIVNLQPCNFAGRNFASEEMGFVWSGVLPDDPNMQMFAIRPKELEPWHWGSWEDWRIRAQLEELVLTWDSAVRNQYYADSIYWDDAVHITWFGPGEMVEQPASVAMEEPLEIDSSLLHYAVPVYRYDRAADQICIIICGYYEGFQFTNTLWLEERDGECRIIRHLLRPGIDLPGVDEQDS